MVLVDPTDDVTQAGRPASVLCVDSDPDYLATIASAASGWDGLALRTETDPEAALDRLDGVDCLVSGADYADTDALALLDRVRDRRPDLPVVVHASTPLDAVGEELLAADWTDYVGKGEKRLPLLAERVRHLVAERRATDESRRYEAALETSREPTLIVDGDGTVAYLNDRLASALPDDRSDLLSRGWERLFTDESVARLREEAFPVAADGWSWTGPTAIHTHAGSSTSPRTSLSLLDDGSMIFAFHGFRADE